MRNIKCIAIILFLFLFVKPNTAFGAGCIININGKETAAEPAQSVSYGLSNGKNSITVTNDSHLKAEKQNIKTLIALYCGTKLAAIKTVSSLPVAAGSEIPRAKVEMTIPEEAENYCIKVFFFEDFQKLAILNNTGKETVANGQLAENDIIADGTKLFVQQRSDTLTNPSWVHIEDNNGYVFLDEEQITLKREMNNGVSFAVITSEHGTSPQDGRYAYVIIPHASAAETAEYAAAPDVRVVSVTKDAHAIFDNASKKYYVNVFDGTYDLSEAGIRLSVCSAIIEIKDKTCEFWISDPTHKNNSITVKLPSGIKSADGADKEYVTYKNDTLTADTSKKNGATLNFSVTLN